jgi:nitronate monooxygenase
VPWRLPVMQAPVGPAATPELVRGVAAAGGLGTLAASWTPPWELREEVRWLRAALDVPFCVNLVLAFAQRERLRLVLEEGANVISFSWGVDAELIGMAHEAGAFVLVQVGDLVAARAASGAGADALVVQGVEAGGHVQAERELGELLQEIRPQTNLPLIAAGGIGDPASVKEARSAGADAIACGTVFLAADEADVHPIYLECLIKAGPADTVLTNLFDGGWPDAAAHRVIANPTFAAWERAGRPQPGNRPGEGEPVASRAGHQVIRYDDAQPTRDTVGDVAQMAMYAGTSVRAVNQREPAAAIIKRLSAEL